MAAAKDLSTSTQEFIACWGDMASHWGVSRTMAQIYALLFVSTAPLDTEQIMAELTISRGNANINLHKLMDWQIVRKVEVPETRRDFFVAEKDIWQLTARIVQERQSREIRPLTESIRQIQQSLQELPDGSPRTMRPEETEFAQNLARMQDFLQLFEQVSGIFLSLLQERKLDQLTTLLTLFAPAPTR
jgi:DNA-binding transcriptional regulator GbsR (MarR family)